MIDPTDPLQLKSSMEVIDGKGPEGTLGEIARIFMCRISVDVGQCNTGRYMPQVSIRAN